MVRRLFIVTAAVEAGAGLAFAISPSVPVTLLLGSSLETSAGVTIGRLAGAALLSLAVACWLARNDQHSRAAAGLIVAMLIYNAAAASLLGMAGIGPGPAGIGLWPAAVLHSAMAVWCVACIRRESVR